MFKLTATLEQGTTTKTETHENLTAEQAAHLRQDYRETTPRGATSTVNVTRQR